MRLTGARFEGGRLPIDSLIELQKYQDIVRIAAVAEWQRQHPGEDAPHDLEDSVRLTIDHIDDGSADIFLAFEQHSIYIEHQESARAAADSIIVAAYTDTEIPRLPGLSEERNSELREDIGRLGSTLQPDQAMELYPDGPEAKPITITIQTRQVAIGNLFQPEGFFLEEGEGLDQGRLSKSEESLTGRVTALDADRMTFDLALSDGQKLHGRYPQHPELLEDLRAVVNSSAEGPLTRITGELQQRNGQLWRFWDTSMVELIQFDETTWGDRLTGFATLSHGWDGGEAEQIASVALEGAQMLLRAIDQAGIERPGVFPTDEGGVLLEWADAAGIQSVEILENGEFETFALGVNEREGRHSATADLRAAVEFVEAEKA